MEKTHRISEYETVRKEMSDRLLFVYGLLPVAVTAIAAYLTLAIGQIPHNNTLLIAMPPLVLIVSAFCYVTSSLLINIYNSGSYLIVYHELDSDAQYLFRSRFLSELVSLATNALEPRPGLHLTDTAQTMGISYLILLVISGIPFLLLSDLSNIKWDITTFFAVAFLLITLIIFACLFARLWGVKSVRDDEMLQYMISKKVRDTSPIFAELERRHHRALNEQTDLPKQPE